MTERRRPKNWRTMVADFKRLQGSPHYVALGMGIGVFVGITPTIPFHTAIALLLAVLLKASKPAAAIGVWFCNPVTLVPLYWASYKIGSFLFGVVNSDFTQIMRIMDEIKNAAHWSIKFSILGNFLQHEALVATAMVVGGVILGILPGIAAYGFTLRFMQGLKQRRERS